MIDLQVIPQALVELFWSKVDQSEGSSACWPWKEARDKDGYGRFWGGTTFRRNIPANRFVLMITVGMPIRSRKQALHDCDNPSCCNPTHLHLGTHKQNHREKMLRGRTQNCTGPKNPPRGSRHPNARVTEEIVRKIRKEYIPRMVSLRFLGKKYGISETNVHWIVTGGTWQHVR